MGSSSQTRSRPLGPLNLESRVLATRPLAKFLDFFLFSNPFSQFIPLSTLHFFLLLKTILRTISFHKLSQSPPHSHSCLRNPSLLSVHNLLSVHLSQSTVNPFLSPLQSQALQKEGTLGVCCTAKETTLLCRLGKLLTAAATCPGVTPPS